MKNNGEYSEARRLALAPISLLAPVRGVIRCGEPAPLMPSVAETVQEHLQAAPASQERIEYYAAAGFSMQNFGIVENDVLIVDGTIKAEHLDIIIAEHDGKTLCRKLQIELSRKKHRPRIVLYSGDDAKHPPLRPKKSDEFRIIGVVRAVIKSLDKRK